MFGLQQSDSWLSKPIQYDIKIRDEYLCDHIIKSTHQECFYVYVNQRNYLRQALYHLLEHLSVLMSLMILRSDIYHPIFVSADM